MNKKKKEISQVIPVFRFILLSIVTAGIYQIVWMYKQWVFFKKKDNLDIMPFWRAIFSVLFIFALSERISGLEKKNEQRKIFLVVVLPIIWIVLCYSQRLPDPYWLIAYLNVVPLIFTLLRMNKYWKKKEKKTIPKSFNWWQIILIIIGALFFIMIVWGSFLP